MTMRLAAALLLTAIQAIPLSVLTAEAAAAETVTLVADEWCPYNCAPGSRREGYMIEIARMALEPAGIAVEYATMPWNRALSEVRSGTRSGAVGAVASEYPSAVYPKLPLGRSGNVLAMKRSAAAGFSYGGIDSLAKLRLGGIQGYSYDSGPIDAYIAKPTGAVELLAGADSQRQNLRKLEAGRIDAVIDNEYVLRLLLSESSPAPDLVLVPVGEASDISIAFSEAKLSESRRYADLIDAALDRARKSGSLATLLAKYGVADWAN